MPLGEGIAFLRAEHHQQRIQGIGTQHGRVDHRHCRQRVLDRLADTWIEGMRIALATFLEIVAVITGGGNTVAIQGDGALHLLLALATWYFEGNTPGRAIRLAADPLEFAGDLDQIGLDTQRRKPVTYPVHCITGEHAVEIQLGRHILAQLFSMQVQMLQAYPCLLTRQRAGIWHLPAS